MRVLLLGWAGLCLLQAHSCTGMAPVQSAVSPGFNSCGHFIVWGQIPGRSQFVRMLGGTAGAHQGHSLQLAEWGGGHTEGSLTVSLLQVKPGQDERIG